MTGNILVRISVSGPHQGEAQNTWSRQQHHKDAPPNRSQLASLPDTVSRNSTPRMELSSFGVVRTHTHPYTHICMYVYTNTQVHMHTRRHAHPCANTGPRSQTQPSPGLGYTRSHLPHASVPPSLQSTHPLISWFLSLCNDSAKTTD